MSHKIKGMEIQVLVMMMAKMRALIPCVRIGSMSVLHFFASE